MKVLIDTHIALWGLYDSDRLSSSSSRILADPVNEVFVSIASAWEIEIKHSIGKLDVPSEDFISDCKAMGFNLLSISEKHISALCKLEIRHKDPFDRMLLAQSISEGMSFLTEDSKLLEFSLTNKMRSKSTH